MEVRTIKNNMKEVANLIGVELNEEFEVVFPYPSDCYATAKLTMDGLKVISTNAYDVLNFKAYLLEHLIKGTYGVKCKPWKPKFNESYYSVGVDGSTEDGTWLNDFLDYTLYKIGNCYRTVEEARANRVKWGEFYDSDKVLTI